MKKKSKVKSQKSKLSSRLGRLVANRRSRRVLFSLGVFLVVFFSSCYFFVIRPGLKVYAAVKEARPHVRALKDSLILQDLQMTKGELRALDEKITKIQTSLKPLSWVKVVPFAKDYYRDAEHLLAVADYGIETGQIVVEAVEPFADVLGFKTEHSEAALDAEKKIQGLVKVMPQIALRMDEISKQFDLIHQELDHVDPNRYPQSFRGQPIRPLLAQARSMVEQVEESMPDIKELLVVLPEALGDPEERTYLVLFQNDKELRPTGGFLTAYALLTIKDGRIIRVSSDDMYHLDLSIPWHPAPPPVLAQYLKVKKYWARDTNLSPDFKESALEFEKFWAVAPNVPKIDGVIGIDTYVVKGLLEVLGPVKLADYEEEFTSENIVYQLELYANLLMKFQWNRKDLLGRLMNAILDKAFHAPREQWKPLFETGLKLAEEKHVLLYLHEPRAQRLAEKYNLAGRIRDFDGDYLHVNDSNFAGAKANLYIQETVIQDYKVSEDGTVIKTVTVNLNNPEPHDGWLNGTYYDWMRIYVPKGSKLISSNSWTAVTSSEELGKTVFTTYTYCYPQNSNSVSVTYELPFKVQKGQILKMLIQKQPGTEGHKYVIRLNGKKIEEFELRADRELSINIQ